ncbi:hypothetical protein PRIPAC_97564 [Pristionchus pacificus]|uniref:G protein-coupled receptor n=1 Tax=Pristionchus pacificus TaxID=54126 RepID=A0A2A6B376_PRIPA|nr:hypothetical protein PRIPAC_97564 [Pristionchus pacificus]|eukprot:PDM60322.1 G protein-coupled receptor [Pristionchus pacificus]
MLYKSVNTVTNDPAGYLEDLQGEAMSNQCLIYVGALCACINIPLLFVFLTSRQFRGRFQLLITLAIADFVNCLSIMAQGLQRSSILLDVIETSLMPIKSPFDCVGEYWLMLREVGGLWAPMVQIIMGLERVLAVFKPAWYNRTYNTRYAIGFLLNLISYCKVRTFMSKTEKNRNLARLRCYLVISAMSTVLVSIPNLINLASTIFERIADEIANAANWATAINSGMNFFVYLALNEEFRNRCKQIVNAIMGSDATGKTSMIEAKSVMSGNVAINAKRKISSQITI